MASRGEVKKRLWTTYHCATCRTELMRMDRSRGVEATCPHCGFGIILRLACPKCGRWTAFFLEIPPALTAPPGVGSGG